MYREKTNIVYYTNLICDEMSKCDEYEKRSTAIIYIICIQL